jgi:hypothetical protein
MRNQAGLEPNSLYADAGVAIRSEVTNYARSRAHKISATPAELSSVQAGRLPHLKPVALIVFRGLVGVVR